MATLDCMCTTWTVMMDEMHPQGEHHPMCPEGQPKPVDLESDLESGLLGDD